MDRLSAFAEAPKFSAKRLGCRPADWFGGGVRAPFSPLPRKFLLFDFAIGCCIAAGFAGIKFYQNTRIAPPTFFGQCD